MSKKNLPANALNSRFERIALKSLKSKFKTPTANALNSTSQNSTARNALNSSICAKKNKAFFTRIQSGKFRGKKLFLPKLDTTRSTKSRVKDCVFSVLRFELAGKIFVEVFGGSGAMALEALSNGAKQVFIIEKDEKAYQIALKNAQNLDKQNAKVFHADSFKLLPQLLKAEFSGFDCEKVPFLQGEKREEKSNKTPIIAYFDPPFHLRSGFDDIYERIFGLIFSLQDSNLELFIIEHSSQMTMPTQLGAFCQSKVKKFGNTTLSFYKNANF